MQKEKLAKWLATFAAVAAIIGAVGLFSPRYAWRIAVSLGSDEAGLWCWRQLHASPVIIALICASCNVARTVWLFYAMKMDRPNGNEEALKKRLTKWRYRALYWFAERFSGTAVFLCGAAPAPFCPLPVVLFLIKTAEKYGAAMEKLDAVTLLCLGGIAKILVATWAGIR